MFGNNDQTCKSKTQDPNGLKRKRKSKFDVGAETSAATEVNANQPTKVNASHPNKVNASHPNKVNASQPTGMNASQPIDASLFGVISDEIILTIPDINTTSADKNQNNQASTQQVQSDINITSSKQKVKIANQIQHDISTSRSKKRGKDKVKQEGKPMRKRSSERIKSKLFQNPITGLGSNLNNPTCLIEDE